ncbi:Maf family protein [Paenibacillus beijingensis]|uniref:dTTP/UTP pyrophosphatase n=1 Tax=Paenibacillus beijingensis TaxID=1126833 RepID=A0A0D5NM30_9BACL|nr:Maf family protein [Paenibacillus beijingensis]AJY76057.1 septum formation protein Maf [Paenibacillus beijingensis]
MTSEPNIPSRLVLASSSPRRQELVASLGLSLPVHILPTDTDESVPSGWTPAQIVERLSLRKARAAARLLAAAGDSVPSLVLGADTIVVLDGDVLGKPANRADAVQTLRRLQGRSHKVYSGMTLIGTHTGAEISAHRMTRVTMKPLDHETIERYVATGEPLDKAGSYGIQGLGATLVSGIEGCYFNVVGLPLSLLSDMLAEQGVPVL